LEKELLKNDLDISVIIATYNRAEMLRGALESIAHLDCEGLSFEIIVVDNNSTDHTREVIESFMKRLPINYLFEERLGKSRALNKALNEVPLGRIVVFTDDDVVVEKNWLSAIVESCKRWPDYSVFGGRILPIWPNDEIPSWAISKWIQIRGFNRHDLGDSDCQYKENWKPNGANFWARKDIFRGGRCFNEAIGPRGRGGTLLDDVDFYSKLTDDGYEFVYSPGATVGHHVRTDMLTPAGVRRRASLMGRDSARIAGKWRPGLFQRHRIVWYSIRFGQLTISWLRLGRAMMSFSVILRVERSWESVYDIGYNVESIRMTWNSKRNSDLHNKI